MRRLIRYLVLLFALAVGHAVLTVGMTVFVFGSGMSRFGTGRWWLRRAARAPVGA